jgi:hypothetical protein
VLCYHANDDAPTWWARALHYSPGGLIWGAHPWGAAGRYGLEKADGHRVRNIDLTMALNAKNVGHSGVFAPDLWPRFAGQLVADIEGALMAPSA